METRAAGHGMHKVAVTRVEYAELLEDSRDEAPLGPTEVAGNTVVSLISPGTELAMFYKGENFPQTPGYAAVFEVQEVGVDVRGLEVGDYAFCSGSHRSFQRWEAQDVLRVPEGLPPEKAVFARMMGVTMSTLTTTSARPPAKVLVTGLGPVGHLAAKIFAACGYEVLACDIAPARRELALRSGIAEVVEAVPLDDPAWNGKTSLVIECSGHEQAVVDGCGVAKRSGEVVLVGVPWRRRTDIFAHELLSAVFHRYVVLRSGWEWQLPKHPTDFRGNSINENYEGALRWLKEGRISVDGLYSVASPKRCQEVYQELLYGRGDKLTVVFDWSQLHDDYRLA